MATWCRLAGQLRAQVLQWTGIPTCVGFGPTKTLAKLASNIAKLAERKQGSYPAHLAQVCNLAAMSREERDAVFAATPAGEVWGIGRRIATRRNAAGVENVPDFVRLGPRAVRAHSSVVLEKTLRGLHGTSCSHLRMSRRLRRS